MIKNANLLHKIRLFLRQGKGNRVILWTHKNYKKKKTLGLPSIWLNNVTMPNERSFVRIAIEMRDKMEYEETGIDFSHENRKLPVSAVFESWISHYIVGINKRRAGVARDKFLEANGDIPVGTISREAITKTVETMKSQNFRTNYIRGIISCILIFCKWAENRDYMGVLNIRNLRPPKVLGKGKAPKL